MHERFATWCGVLVAALVALGAIAAPANAAPSTPKSVTLVHQTPVVALNGANSAIDITVRNELSNPHWSVSLFARVRTRSALNQVIDGTYNPNGALSSTSIASLRCATGNVATFVVGVGEGRGRAPRSCGSADPYLDAHCHGAGCDGVYPLEITFVGDRGAATVWSLVTLLGDGIAHPLQLSMIFTSDDAGAGQGRQASDLQSIARYPQVALNVAVDYRGTARAVLDNSASGARYRLALSRAVASDSHRIMDAPPSDVDFAGLSAHRLNGDIVAQARTATSLASHFVSATAAVPIVLSGRVTSADLAALGKEGVLNVVLPDSTFTTPPGEQLTWGEPFRVLGAAQETLALSADGGLRTVLDNQRLSAGARCALALGTMSLLHFEAPNAPATRTLVVDASLADLPPTMVSALLDEISHDPVLTTASTASIFLPGLVGANGYPASRALRHTSAPAWTGDNAATATSLATEVQSFNESVSSLRPITPLQVDLLLAERRMSPALRQHDLNSVGARLLSQLAEFHIDDTTITLTANDTPLPITITSSANYHFSGWVSLQGSGVSFPDGDVIPVNITGTTEALRVPVVVTSSSNFILQVHLLTSNRLLVVATAAIQVRGSGVSAVGYALTIASLLVIALWWWRTSRRRKPARHAS